jgi:hypothetical protein
MAERVKFPGSDDPIQPIREEKLKPQKVEAEADEDEEDDEAEPLPEYKREEIGPRIGDPLEAGKEVEAVKEQLDTDDMVPLLFPHKVSLQDKGIMHHWAAGVHLVPVSLAGADKKGMHWWLKHNRVRRAGSTVPNAAASAKAADAE